MLSAGEEVYLSLLLMPLFEFICYVSIIGKGMTLAFKSSLRI